MDTKTLQHMVSLSENLHFGQASRQCNVSPSALSRSIQALEQEVGAELFRRDNRRVELTSAGHQFLDYAREALQRYRAIRGTIVNSTALYGELSVYCSVTASFSVLYELMVRYRKDYPEVDIKLSTGDAEHAIARVVDGLEDITIAPRPASLPRDGEFKSVRTSPLVFIAAKDTLLFQRPQALDAGPEAWADVPMILPEGGVGRDSIDAWFRAIKQRPRIYAQVSGNEAIVSMVSLGLGVGVVPDLVLEHSPFIERIAVLDVEPMLPAYDVGLFTLSKHLANPILRAFWDLVV